MSRSSLTATMQPSADAPSPLPSPHRMGRGNAKATPSTNNDHGLNESLSLSPRQRGEGRGEGLPRLNRHRSEGGTHPLVIAHRGAHEGRPELENKLPAFERALAIGVDAVECDVHLSADNEPVVVHDDTLDRTTTASGHVNAYTAAELRQLGVPTLRELCRIVRGKARLLVELKSASPDRVLDVIFAEKMERSVLVFSFHHELLRPIASFRPNIELAFLLSRFNAAVPDLDSFIAVARELRATTLAPNHKLCTQRFVRDVHAAGLRVFAWTADSLRQQRALIAARVDGIITNFPERLKTLL